MVLLALGRGRTRRRAPRGRTDPQPARPLHGARAAPAGIGAGALRRGRPHRAVHPRPRRTRPGLRCRGGADALVADRVARRPERPSVRWRWPTT
jgi:hypothetical protein